jgi:uncharacterized protein (DUF1697 family)
VGVVIALLRAVNVGGRSMKMADLVVLAGELGCENPRTLLQSGNLVFETELAADAALESGLEAAIEARFGFSVDVVLRTAAEWRDLAAQNPFPEEVFNDPSRLLAMLLKTAPVESALIDLRCRITGRDRIELVGRNLYLVYPDGIGRSTLAIQVIERRLGTRGTARNWNTVAKLAQMAGV